MVVDTREQDNNLSDFEDLKNEISDSVVKAELKLEEPSPGQYEHCCIVIFGIPIVSGDRLEKFKKVLGKLLVVVNSNFNDYYPLNEQNTTKGFCFVEFPLKEIAEIACAFFANYVLDKNHTLSVYLLSAFSNITEPDWNWTPPQEQKYIDAGDLWWWLQNPKCLDQFAIQVENPLNGTVSIAVYWNGRGTDPSIVNDESIREDWSENIFKWSPYGSYLATFHKKGILLWGGEKFEKIQKLVHDNVNFIEFSPKESFLITYARDSCSNDSENCLRIFDVFTGESKRSFSPFSQNSKIHNWPFFKWSHDEKYFAFCRPKDNKIYVYNTETFTLDNNKPIELEGLAEFEWNPTKNLIAYHNVERTTDNAPAVIGIIEYPSRNEIRAQRIFSVLNAQLFWQKSGAYLAAYTKRYNNARKIKETEEYKFTGVACHLEIFDCTEKDIALQTIKLSEPFINFEWDPKGNKFCVLVGNANKVTPLVYRLEKGKPTPTLISKIEPGVQFNTIKWAPQGGWLVVFGANSTVGHVAFIDGSGLEATRVRLVEHSSLNQGCWDPTGRYFVTCSSGRNRYESGYRIHTFQGRELIRKNIETLLRFKWRPRPPAPIAEQKAKEIRKNLKQISQKFEEEDRREQLKVSKEIIDKRREIMAQFDLIRVANQKLYEQEKADRIKLRNGVDTDQFETDLIEQTITIPLTTEMKPIVEESIKSD